MKRNALSQCVLQTEDEGRRRKLIGSRRRLAKFNEVKSKKARRLRSTKQSPASSLRSERERPVITLTEALRTCFCGISYLINVYCFTRSAKLSSICCQCGFRSFSF
ncbi:hypothetical protein Csa_015908 [Cucumis sativus]|uniref:Uncharacterized protein n=1 Tax=Cucumis sativus TaxID=3659 RepID=A0A0A0K5X5_CUCSA|nr:hypothetical protein Csa_015908 [Cucumis sativus]